MQRGRAIPREQLAELLWSRSGGEHARRSLRQCLMSVRAALKAASDNALLADGDSMSVANGPAIGLDVIDFEVLGRSQDTDDLESASALYRDEFLTGLQIASEPISDWISMERRRLASARSDVLYRLASAYLQRGDAERAIAAAEHLTAFDPLREDAHRLLMRALAAAARRSAALKQHALCVEILRRDLGIAPEPATTQLAETIRKGVALTERWDASPIPDTLRASDDARGKATGNAAPSLDLPDKPSIAVLPFANLSGDSDQDYFTNGITDDLAIALGRIPWLFVIATTSTAAYAGHAVDVQQVGSALGVRYLLRGSMRKDARHLRVVIQLIDASHGRQIWSDRFDGELDDVFAIQDRVTAQVSASLAPALQSAEMERTRHQPTESLSAFDLYLRAVPRLRASLADNREAIRLLRKAIEIDPSYGAAYGLASRCYQFQKLLHLVPPTDPQLNEGIRLAEIAVDIGKNDSEALWMAGHALAQLSGEVERAIALIDRSLELNPNSANALVSSCNVRSCTGDAEAAIDQFHLAHRLNPLDASHHPVRWNVLALAYLSAGDYEETERAADKALTFGPTYLPALRMKVVARGLLGGPEQGREHVERLLAVNAQESVKWLNAFWRPMTDRHPRLLADIIEGARRAGLPEGGPA
jgi:TolB-like protein/DNA-binding SARP family transcriptional activator